MMRIITCISLISLCASAFADAPYPSTYSARPSQALLIRGASAYTGTGETFERLDVRVRDGRIEAVGQKLTPNGARVVEAAGRWLTPGIIDVHSHLGDYPSPSVDSTADGNEATRPNTANVWAEHSVWPQDPQFAMALAGGVTTLQILPGSANLFGGRSVVLKNVPSRTMQGMKFPNAKQGLKIACGENPKRVYGQQGKSPATRMGNVAGFRAAWSEAQAYRKDLQSDDPDDHPDRDLALDTLAAALDGDLLVHNHCYRADEMAVMIDLAKEFGFRIGTFHHAVESYKIADLLAAENICSALWPDWWGFKLEAFDGIAQNVALVHQAGACAIVHSDSARTIQRLNQETAKSLAAARRVGMNIPRGVAWQWIGLNAAKALGLEDEVGSLEVGKAADLVLWDRDPLSVYAKADQVYIDGYRYFDRQDPSRQPCSDFDLAQTEGCAVAGGAR